MNHHIQLTTKISLYIMTTLSLVAVAAFVVPRAAADNRPVTPESGSSIDERIELRKSDRSVSLDEAEERRLERRCTQSQSTVRQLQNSKAQMLNNRADVYNRISGKTWLGIGGIRLADGDVFALKRHALNLDDKVEDFNSNASLFNQTIRDILQMNCEADVEGFKALVETAQEYDRLLLSLANDIRSLVNNDIRNEFERLGRQL